ncbi:MAG: hypothetical protein KatS3mg070_3189 [Meiothermus sp.]|nr:MAG: hypothetical protein KatS3mg070_3189 [Meiothermus sp.]
MAFFITVLFTDVAAHPGGHCSIQDVPDGSKNVKSALWCPRNV